MSRVASSPENSALDVHAFEWGEGHSRRFATAEQLTKGRFAAPTIVVIDSCFTQAVYGQHIAKRDERRNHNIQTLHTNDIKLKDDADIVVLQTYELVKHSLFDFYENPEESFGVARSTAGDLISHFPRSVQSQTGIEALSW